MTSAAMQLLDPFLVVPSPWRNGAGATRELATATGSAGEPLWRISMADLDRSGAFSTFPETDRLFVALGPLRLTIDGTERMLQAGDQTRFAGEAEVTVAPVAPTRALNVMTRRGEFCAEVTLHARSSAGSQTHPPDVDVTLVDLGDRIAEVRMIPVGTGAKYPDV